MMQTLDLAKIQEQLVQERTRLTQRVAASDRENEQAKERNPDRTDLSWDYTMRERKVALLSVEKKTLAQIETAMQRLEAGAYGECVQCGERINPERLEVLPYATLCMRCQASAGT